MCSHNKALIWAGVALSCGASGAGPKSAAATPGKKKKRPARTPVRGRGARSNVIASSHAATLSNFTSDTPSFSGSPLPAKETMFGASVQPRRQCAPGGLAPKAAAGQIAGTMPPLSQPEWTISPGLTDYDTALADMEARAAAIHAGEIGRAHV